MTEFKHTKKNILKKNNNKCKRHRKSTQFDQILCKKETSNMDLKKKLYALNGKRKKGKYKTESF